MCCCFGAVSAVSLGFLDALEILSALSDYFIYIRKYTTNFLNIIPSLSWPLWPLFPVMVSTSPPLVPLVYSCPHLWSSVHTLFYLQNASGSVLPVTRVKFPLGTPALDILDCAFYLLSPLY